MNDSGPRVSDPATFESFLVEDVILTLGNLRGSLGWLGEGAATDRACLVRLDRQLALLEDRAHRMAHALRDAAAASEPANLFAAPDAGQARGQDRGQARGQDRERDRAPDFPALAAIDSAILDALAAERAEDAPPVFRSRRA
ncbi:hypothetical protein [Albidovulum sp.]|jgi:hypothetical protein|uniref:hypothetical protein n=1 Tax=Albidovulum sp. TaxID=1872424 RepID=UPI00303D4090